ncbi:hypothetical protein BC937DRAFT_94640 [Endogone sp. FLAS-F59071]|nr:hypothetical protein BC937DRAFT_94640 [Endogone sp. FLAS-F59071]|eukprot:RUS13880.1 hypothetical protein BC937DRAFT_94640 [Endogone sp. FLAS-F59071]
MSGKSNSSFTYRSFQQVWDPYKIDSPGRTREACLRCRVKRNKCDGEKPCRRCLRLRAECVYTRQQKEQAEALREVSRLEQMLDEMGIEIVQLRQEKAAKAIEFVEKHSDMPNDVVGKQKDQNQSVSTVVLGSTQTGNDTWIIKMTKKGIQLQINGIRQLSEFLEYMAGSSTIDREPKMTHRPIGTRAVMFISTAQYPRWHKAQIFQRNKYKPLPLPLVGRVNIDIAMDIEEALLNIILLQTVECSASLSGKKLSERFLSQDYHQQSQSFIQQGQSASYTGLCYAIGAVNAHHVLTFHTENVERQLSAHSNSSTNSIRSRLTEIDKTDIACALAGRYFDKAREIIIDLVVELESDSLCMETVDALHVMCWYLCSQGQHKSAMFYLGLAIQVAIQLNFHKALRSPRKPVVEITEVENAIMWNVLACTDQVIASFSKLPANTSVGDTYLNLLGVTIRVPANMPEDRVQRLNECIHLAKSSAISRDYIEAWWADDAPSPIKEQLDRFLAAFNRWSAELPQNLQISALASPSKSRASFLLVVNLQLHYHMLLIHLYFAFLPSVHRKPSSLPPGFQRSIEWDYSKAAIMVTKLTLTYVRAGGCSLPYNQYLVKCEPQMRLAIAAEAHMRLSNSEDVELAKISRAYVARVLRIVRESKEYRFQQPFALAYCSFLEEFMARERIDAEADVILGAQDYFVPIKVPGISW